MIFTPQQIFQFPAHTPSSSALDKSPEMGDENRDAQTSGVAVISPIRLAMPSISMRGIQFLYPAVLRDRNHVADPSTLNDKESNMKVDLLPDVGKACFISLVKQKGKQ